MNNLLKRWSLVSVCVLTLISSCTQSSGKKQIVGEFFKLREAGNTEKAWEMLSESSRKVFTEKEFNEYCFIYKVSETLGTKKEGEYFKIRYNFYDKKFKKDSQELYTFYIRENVENLKVVKGGIAFPYIGYLALRQAIEKGKMDDVKVALKKMLKVDNTNPDILKSAQDMDVSGN